MVALNPTRLLVFHQHTSLRSRLINGSFWSVVGAVVSRGLTLASAIIVGRLLGAAGFGEFGIIQSTLGLFGVFAGTSLGVAATKHVAEYRNVDNGRAGRCITMSLTIAVLSGFLMTCVLFLLAPWIASRVLGSAHLVWELRIASGLVVFAVINGVQNGTVIGLEQYQPAAVMAILRGISLFILTSLGVYYLGLIGAVTGLVVSEAISALINQFLLKKVCRRVSVPIAYGKTEWSEARALCRFALPVFFASAIIYPAMWLSNVLLVKQPGGYASLGLFAAADRWRQVLLFFPVSASAIILPMLSNLHGERNDVGFRKVLLVNILLSVGSILITGGVLIGFSGVAMSAYGADYAGGKTVLIILSVSSLAIVLNNVLGQALVSLGAVWWRSGVDVILAILLLCFSWWLIPIYHENGLAAANLIAYAVPSIGLLLFVPFILRRVRREVYVK